MTFWEEEIPDEDVPVTDPVFRALAGGMLPICEEGNAETLDFRSMLGRAMMNCYLLIGRSPDDPELKADARSLGKALHSLSSEEFLAVHDEFWETQETWLNGGYENERKPKAGDPSKQDNRTKTDVDGEEAR